MSATGRPERDAIALPRGDRRGRRAWLRNAWTSRSARERAAIAVGALVVLAALAYAWAPTRAASLAAESERARVHRAVDLAARRADEAAALGRQPMATVTTDVRAAVLRVLDARGLRGAASGIAIDGDTARVTLAETSFDALVGLLDALAREERLYPVEATIAPRVEPGRLRAELALRRDDR